MPRYRTRPVEVEAVQLTAEMLLAYVLDGVPLPTPLQFGSANYYNKPRTLVAGHCRVHMVGGQYQNVEIGDWVVTHAQGLPDVFTDAAFRATYEPVLGTPSPTPWCKCSRCGKQLFTNSTGNFNFNEGRKEWVGVCLACLRPEED